MTGVGCVLTPREYYRKTIHFAGLAAVAAPPLLAFLAILANAAAGSNFPWISARLIIGGVAGSIFFGLPAWGCALLFLAVSRKWSGRAHFWALLLSPALVSAALCLSLMGLMSSPPNEFPAASELPYVLGRFSLIVLIPGYLFVGAAFALFWFLRTRGMIPEEGAET